MATGYGRDMSTTSAAIRYVGGWRLVAESLLNRVRTRRGTVRSVRPNSDADAWGIDLSDYLGANGHADTLKAIPGIIFAQWKNDERVADVQTRAFISTERDGTSSILVENSVQLEDSAESFELTFSVTTEGVNLLTLELS